MTSTDDPEQGGHREPAITSVKKAAAPRFMASLVQGYRLSRGEKCCENEAYDLTTAKRIVRVSFVYF